MKHQKANAGQAKLKIQLKLSISRLRMVQQKDSAKVKQQRREMAQLIEVWDFVYALCFGDKLPPKATARNITNTC